MMISKEQKKVSFCIKLIKMYLISSNIKYMQNIEVE